MYHKKNNIDSISTYRHNSARHEEIWNNINHELDALDAKKAYNKRWKVSLASLSAAAIITVFVISIGVESNVNQNSQANRSSELVVLPTIETDSTTNKPKEQQSIHSATIPTENNQKLVEQHSIAPSKTKTQHQYRSKFKADTICAGEAYQASVHDKTGKVQVEWTIEGVGNIQSKELQHIFNYPGAYQISLNIIDKSTSQVLLTEYKQIVVNPKPNALFDAVCSDLDLHNPAMCFSAVDTTGKHLWKLGDGRETTEATIKHIYAKKGIYNVRHKVLNSFGCVDSSKQQVKVSRGYNLMALPTFNISEDKDWMPIALLNNQAEFELSIVNETGETVFTTSSPSEKWDGRLLSGKVKAGETYFWLARVQETDGRFEYGGAIVIVE